LRAEAKRRGWEIRDFRTGRKAARIGVPTALGLGAAAGAVAAGVSLRRARASSATTRFALKPAYNTAKKVMRTR
jgi:homoserine kinase